MLIRHLSGDVEQVDGYNMSKYQRNVKAGDTNLTLMHISGTENQVMNELTQGERQRKELRALEDTTFGYLTKEEDSEKETGKEQPAVQEENQESMVSVKREESLKNEEMVSCVKCCEQLSETKIGECSMDLPEWKQCCPWQEHQSSGC